MPRPETEILVERALAYVKKIDNQSFTMIDVGTGCGCIAIIMALSGLFKKIYAVDVSSAVLKIAMKNAQRHKVFDQITFIESNLLNAVEDTSIDIVLANLPYLSKCDDLDPSVKYEPKLALIAGESGLELYEELFRQIRELNLRPRYIGCEIGLGQVKAMKSVISRFFLDFFCQIHDDFSGIPRMIELIRK